MLYLVYSMTTTVHLILFIAPYSARGTWPLRISVSAGTTVQYATPTPTPTVRLGKYPRPARCSAATQRTKIPRTVAVPVLKSCAEMIKKNYTPCPWSTNIARPTRTILGSRGVCCAVRVRVGAQPNSREAAP